MYIMSMEIQNIVILFFYYTKCSEEKCRILQRFMQKSPAEKPAGLKKIQFGIKEASGEDLLRLRGEYMRAQCRKPSYIRPVPRGLGGTPLLHTR